MSKGITSTGELIATFNGFPLGIVEDMPPMPYVVLGDGGYLVPPELIAAIMSMRRGKGKKCEPKT